MSRPFSLLRIPLIWRVTLAVALLMILVSAVITERVLNRLGTIQQIYLQSTADSYVNGVNASISSSVINEDSWEIFDVLERLKPTNTAIVPIQTIVTNKAGTILAATDPVKHPSLSQLPEDLISQFSSTAIRISSESALAFLERDIQYQDKKIGKIYTVFDAKTLLNERKEVLTTLILTNALVTALLAFGGFLTVRRMLRPLQTLESHMIEAVDGKAQKILVGSSLARNWEARRLFRAYNSLIEADEQRRELSFKLAEEERLASLGRLSSVMAHEINNPLGGLLNAVDTIRKHGANAQIRDRSVDLLERGLQGIAEVVRGALATYRPDRQSRPLGEGDFHDVKMLISPELRQRNQKLDLETDWDSGFACNLPSGPVRQAMTNLLLNASAASYDHADLLLKVKRSADRLQIEVGDRGGGLPIESVKMLTGQIEKSLPAGKGLGLWVVRQIASELDAKLEVTPRAGGGSIISMALPIEVKPEIENAA
ncbi:MAG: HAMP domain-containing sensor histidine kinase [Ahrensia sp.]|nr:HAMP domain-containing sensor histidine kinase [Ahrensia sp.]